MNNKPQRHKYAIVTLLIGADFQARWERLCRENWENYAYQCGCDLVVLSEPLDTSIRAKERSPSWQKCLIPELKQLASYQQLAWVDADIYFNPLRKPSLFEGVPIEKVGAVDSFADPSPEENAEALQRMARHLLLQGTSWKPYYSPEDVYRAYGAGVEALPRMINAGVLVFSPEHHADLFRYVYDHFEDSGDPSYYENVPLSYELVNRNLVHWMNPKFNHLWVWDKYLHYSFLFWHPRSYRDKLLKRVAKWSGNDYEHRTAQACVTAALLNCHLLHFAGTAKEMELVDMESAKEGRIRDLGVR